ncbi:MAG: alpha/beta hydrolase [Parasphingorhabdus sp.]|uniref:alpha/beta hydrolase n=1 Tax=Parasphingorhabdus sp. TaxID=2709688 RepID=UPI0030021985
MKQSVVIAFVAIGLIASTIAQSRAGDRLKDRLEQRKSEATATMSRSAKGAQRLSYGDDKAQHILFFRADRSHQRPPLAVFIHGGGWKNGAPELVDNKPEWFARHGWAFASVGYRLLPDSPVEEQARDIGRALDKLRSDAVRLGFDANRIILFGHSAGAHLTALVSTDPSYALASFSAIRGAILIDGACYDIPSQIAASRFMARRTYIPAFGTDPARQRELSPVTHAGGRDVPNWLLLYTSARDDAQAQSKLLSSALKRGGVQSDLVEIQSKTDKQLTEHRAINVEFGTAGYAGNPAIEAIMQRVAE